MEGKIQELKQLKQRIEELERKQVAEIAKVNNLLAAWHGRDTEAHRVIVDWDRHRKAFLKDWQEKLLHKYGIVVGSSPASPADSFTSAAEKALSLRAILRKNPSVVEREVRLSFVVDPRSK